MYPLIFRHIFSRMDAERAHELAAFGLRTASNITPARQAISALWARNLPKTELFGQKIAGRMGLAAGFDKNATMVPALLALGFGFVEIGTVTAQAQAGNPRPRLQRVIPRRAVVNAMGFNNDGADVVARRLAKLRTTPAGKNALIGVNIGKSKLAMDAVADYQYSTSRLAPHASYLVINVSSPNTPGLRDLQAIEHLRPIISAVKATAEKVGRAELPILVKIAPDLANEDIKEVAQLVLDERIAGVVATNTTINHTYGAGGMSGVPLQGRAREVVGLLRTELGPDPIIIGVGGIAESADARELLAAGADVVQAYTAFIYQGPAWPARVNREIT